MSSPTVTPQAVLAPLSPAAIFLVVTVNPGGETATRSLLGDLLALTEAVGTLAPNGALNCVAGIGSEAYDRLIGGARPAQLHTLPVFAGDSHTAPSTPGDVLFHIRALSMDLCFALAERIVERLGDAVSTEDEVHGFAYFDARNIQGFVDGTENPTGAVAAGAVLIGDEDPSFADGSYVIVQKYLHNMASWNAIPVEEQEKVVGRTKVENVEFEDDVLPPNAHIALNKVHDSSGEEMKILRRNMPFGRAGFGEYGTYFIGYAGDPAVTEQMLSNMFLGTEDAAYDRILDFSTAVTGTFFFVPSQTQLDALT